MHVSNHNKGGLGSYIKFMVYERSLKLQNVAILSLHKLYISSSKPYITLGMISLLTEPFFTCPWDILVKSAAAKK